MIFLKQIIIKAATQQRASFGSEKIKSPRSNAETVASEFSSVKKDQPFITPEQSHNNLVKVTTPDQVIKRISVYPNLTYLVDILSTSKISPSEINNMEKIGEKVIKIEKFVKDRLKCLPYLDEDDFTLIKQYNKNFFEKKKKIDSVDELIDRLVGLDSVYQHVEGSIPSRVKKPLFANNTQDIVVQKLIIDFKGLQNELSEKYNENNKNNKNNKIVWAKILSLDDQEKYRSAFKVTKFCLPFFLLSSGVQIKDVKELEKLYTHSTDLFNQEESKPLLKKAEEVNKYLLEKYGISIILNLKKDIDQINLRQELFILLELLVSMVLKEDTTIVDALFGPNDPFAQLFLGQNLTRTNHIRFLRKTLPEKKMVLVPNLDIFTKNNVPSKLSTQDLREQKVDDPNTNKLLLNPKVENSDLGKLLSMEDWFGHDKKAEGIFQDSLKKRKKDFSKDPKIDAKDLFPQLFNLSLRIQEIKSRMYKEGVAMKKRLTLSELPPVSQILFSNIYYEISKSLEYRWSEKLEEFVQESGIKISKETSTILQRNPEFSKMLFCLIGLERPTIQTNSKSLNKIIELAFNQFNVKTKGLFRLAYGYFNLPIPMLGIVNSKSGLVHCFSSTCITDENSFLNMLKLLEDGCEILLGLAFFKQRSDDTKSTKIVFHPFTKETQPYTIEVQEIHPKIPHICGKIIKSSSEVAKYFPLIRNNPGNFLIENYRIEKAPSFFEINGRRKPGDEKTNFGKFSQGFVEVYDHLVTGHLYLNKISEHIEKVTGKEIAQTPEESELKRVVKESMKNEKNTEKMKEDKKESSSDEEELDAKKTKKEKNDSFYSEKNKVKENK